MARDPYLLDVCLANGPLLVSREIANYLRRVPKVSPAGVTYLELQESHIKPCFTLYASGRGVLIPMIDTPTAASARFLAESLATLWNITTVYDYI